MFPISWSTIFRKKDGSLVNMEDALSGGGGGGGYTLPTATASRLGGVKIGSGVTVAEDGTISVSGGGGGSFEFRTGSRNFNQGGGTYNSAPITFDTPFSDANYIILHCIKINGTPSDTAKIPINYVVTNQTASGASGRIYNANDEMVSGTLVWIAIKL